VSAPGSAPVEDISEVPEVQPGIDAPFEGASPAGAPQRPTMAPLGARTEPRYCAAMEGAGLGL
jgi:hypothetical protein